MMCMPNAEVPKTTEWSFIFVHLSVLMFWEKQNVERWFGINDVEMVVDQTYPSVEHDGIFHLEKHGSDNNVYWERIFSNALIELSIATWFSRVEGEFKTGIIATTSIDEHSSIIKRNQQIELKSKFPNILQNYLTKGQITWSLTHTMTSICCRLHSLEQKRKEEIIDNFQS